MPLPLPLRGVSSHDHTPAGQRKQREQISGALTERVMAYRPSTLSPKVVQPVSEALRASKPQNAANRVNDDVVDGEAETGH
jgi:hypothetical protein